ncbi:MAG: DNA-binding protein [Leptospiraceae bacterium]|nr:MAG: DNA-binding protein [Leptospiraceae bacterium]
MTNSDLAKSYFIKIKTRLKVLYILFEDKDYSDVVRESQELVELALKGLLRYAGIEPPKIHDVGNLLIEYKDRFDLNIQKNVETLATISKRLRKERELSFYGDIDFIPTESYTEEDAKKCIEDAEFVYNTIKHIFENT